MYCQSDRRDIVKPLADRGCGGSPADRTPAARRAPGDGQGVFAYALCAPAVLGKQDRGLWGCCAAGPVRVGGAPQPGRLGRWV